MIKSSGMSRGAVKKQLSRVKDVHLRLANAGTVDKDLKGIHFDIGILAKCCEKLLQDNDELKAEIEKLKSGTYYVNSSKGLEEFHNSVMDSAVESTK